MANSLIWRYAVLHGQDIVKLLSDSCSAPLAIIVSNYISKAHANHLYHQFRNHSGRNMYDHEMHSAIPNAEPVMKMGGLDKIGVAYNSTYGKPLDSIEVKKYYDAIPGYIADMAKRCAPYSNPIHQFIKEMNSGSNKYPFGMQIAAFDNRPMYSGIVRIMEPDMDGSYDLSEKPHIDKLPNVKCKLVKQLTCNIYLAVPSEQDKSGGYLELWDTRNIPFEIDTNMLHRDDLRHFLELNGGKPITVTPKQGDLIIFNSRKPHSVKKLLRGDRITLQTFIGYQGEGKPLLCWN